MGAYYFITEFPTDTSSRYAHRISQSTWKQYRPTIQNLHDTGLTRRQILAELAQHDFNPSFGQLVAQMTRWRMVRYSKPFNSPPRPAPLQLSQPHSPGVSSSVKQRPVAATGIIYLASILQLAEQQQSNLMPLVMSQLPESTSASKDLEQNGLTDLMTMLSLNANSPKSSEVPVVESPEGHQDIFEIADMLFLGEAYHEAFDAYLSIIVQLTKPVLTIEDEQIKIQALIGCLKSAATEDQHNKAVVFAQVCLDAVSLTASAPDAESYSNTSRTVLGEVFDKWYDRNCALAKVTFDLLTTYKQLRSWSTPQQVRWAHDITAREWMCSRLVRLPTWDVAVPWLDSTTPQLLSSQVFEPRNIHSILSWATSAIDDFSPLYDKQLHQLQLHSEPPATTSAYRILLFWRLNFSSKHSQPACPPLQVHLTPDTTFTTSSSQTAAVIAHTLILQYDDDNCSSARYTSDNLLQLLHFYLGDMESHEARFGRFWNALREVLAPSFQERFGEVD